MRVGENAVMERDAARLSTIVLLALLLALVADCPGFGANAQKKDPYPSAEAPYVALVENGQARAVVAAPAAPSPPGAVRVLVVYYSHSKYRNTERFAQGVAEGVRQVPAAQVEFGGRQKRIVYCRDPEGNLLELCVYE